MPSYSKQSYGSTLSDKKNSSGNVYLLKSLTAKAVCEELKNLFMNVGVPSVITRDQGSNFTSSLTKEFLKMFRVTPRFNTPGHPESSGIVERWNQRLRK